MDASPLTLAQSHALKASKASTPTAAIDEHDLAAGQFATAAKGIENTSEAFRTLKLLEQHHEKLAQILKFRTSHPTAQPQAQGTNAEAKPVPQLPRQPDAPKANESSPYRSPSQSLPAAHRPPRDVSSSIATNLASARGIPSNRQRRSGQASSPVVAPAHVEGKIVSPPKGTKLRSQNERSTSTQISEKAQIVSNSAPHPTAPPSNATASLKSQSPEDPKPDEPFQRFYSTFESLFSKLSAPLAFAGLPLNPEDPPQQLSQPTSKKPPKPEERATADPEYSRLFSKAALRAVREEPGGNHLGPAESFYVVPTAGGTKTYASMIRLDRDGMRKSEDMDEFVDARETPGPPSPEMTRKGNNNNNKKPTNADLQRIEELQLANETLKSAYDNVARRLQDFEMGAQTSSMALHQSIRANMRQSPAASVVGDAERERLEEQVREVGREMERMRKENEKLKGVVGRYRERWEKLKEGARVRREGSGGGRDEDL